MCGNLKDPGQPAGAALGEWRPALPPPRAAMDGRTCRVEPVDRARHAMDLYTAFAAADDSMWSYLSWGPFASAEAVGDYLESIAELGDQLAHAVVDRDTDRAQGLASYLRISPGHGVIEVGSIAYAPILQRTIAATEAMYLMMRRAFDELGYRRYEWKCDALNAPSRKAARRFGFRFEGIFRQHMVVRGRNRDTAWFAVLDGEWPALRAAMERWLAPENFDAAGNQRRALSDLTRTARELLGQDAGRSA